MMTLLVLFVTLAFLHSLVSARLGRTLVTAPIVRSAPSGLAACRCGLAAAGLAVGLSALAGCAAMRHGTEATRSVIGSAMGMGHSGESNFLERVQIGVMREADLYVGVVAQATDDFRGRVPTIEARNMAQQWKVTQATAAYVTAAGEYPTLNAVDMLVLATLSRYVVEDYWVGEEFGESTRPLLESHRMLESNAWAVAQVILTPAQQDEVRALLGEYRRRYPHVRYVAAVRIQELAGVLPRLPPGGNESKKPGALRSLIDLNLLAGLDPATQAIQQTRLLAQRMMYYAQRVPTLLSWQAELTLYQLAAQPEARQVFSNLNDVSESTKVFARTAEGLTDLVDAQREAAIDQIFDRLAAECTNLFAALAVEEAKVRGLLDETRQTLGAGDDMAKSVNAAIESLDAFVHDVSPPATNDPPIPPDTNSRPFNVLDYGAAAAQIGAMATNLTATILAVNQSEAQVSRLTRQATADAKEVINYAFRLAVILIVLAGAVLAVVVWIGRRASGSSARRPGGTTKQDTE